MNDRRALIERFSQAWNARDIDTLMSLMSDDCEFHSSVGPLPGTSYRGRAEVERAYTAFLAAPHDPCTELGPLTVLVAEDFAVTTWSTSTKRPGDDPVVVAACDVFQFDGGTIKSKDTYRKVVGTPPC